MKAIIAGLFDQVAEVAAEAFDRTFLYSVLFIVFIWIISMFGLPHLSFPS